MLPATLVVERAMSDFEFEQFCFRNDLVQIERTRDGAIQLYPLNGARSSFANALITGQLGQWCHQRARGMVVGSDAGFFLPDGSMLCPNAAYISNESIKSVPRLELRGIPHLCPDFVIELLTNWKRLEVLEKKMPLWITNGASLAWLIDPNRRIATVYKPGDEPKSARGKWLEGDGPVAGFKLDLEEIWDCYRNG